ncbi:MAG: GDP-mannose 4,6-dehydratase [Chloroflexota bacterium]|nr:GDP-mannose 4,6-dehydratase [Chloroflexota bacterium]NOG64076.1 GDP-mannose 4,6-dehydratase [Chloroflexota bacterium]GIK65621.1 MAG: GDP-mannose 4,6-dehydratase [Chloroflexota bacterium]
MAQQKTALVTGITGQDGSYLADLLLEKGYRVVGLARRSTNYRYPNIDHLIGKITLEYGDLIDGDRLCSLVQKYQPDEVYNIAAQSVPADSWNQPIVTAEITAVGVVRMLEAVLRHKPDARFYQATSREIFGGVPYEVCDEETPFSANNPYGIAKQYAHLMTMNYRESYGLFACGGILFNHESERRSLHFVTRKVTMAAACIKLGVKNPPLNELGEPLVQNGKLRIGNLDAVRDWGYAKEYVEAMWLMLQHDQPRDYVIGTNTIYTVRDLCRVAFEQVGLNWENHVECDQRFMRPTEIAASRGDYSRAKRELGWEPRTNFEELIRLMVNSDLALLTT